MREYLLPLFCSLSLHAVGLTTGTVGHNAQLHLKTGVAAVHVRVSAVSNDAALSSIEESAPEALERQQPLDAFTSLVPRPKETQEKQLSDAKGKADEKPSHSAQAASNSSVGALTPAALAGHLAPEYPLFSRRRGEEGRVIYEVQVGTNGRAQEVRLISSSGHRRLDAAASKALLEAEYMPAQEGLKAVVSKKQVAVHFVLEK